MLSRCRRFTLHCVAFYGRTLDPGRQAQIELLRLRRTSGSSSQARPEKALRPRLAYLSLSTGFGHVAASILMEATWMWETVFAAAGGPSFITCNAPVTST